MSQQSLDQFYTNTKSFALSQNLCYLLGLILVIAVLSVYIAVELKIVYWSSEKPMQTFVSGGGVLVTSPSSSLDPTFGTSRSDRFAGMPSVDELKAKSHFLNGRVGPEVWGSQEAADYWTKEVVSTGADAEEGTTTIAAEQQKQQANAQASRFASSPDVELALTSRAYGMS